MLQYARPQQSVNYTPPATADRPVRAISGRRLSHLTKDASANDRALLAHEIERGALQILRPTRTQAAALTKSSPSYVATMSSDASKRMTLPAN